MYNQELAERNLPSKNGFPDIVSKLNRGIKDIFCWGDVVWMGAIGNDHNHSEEITLNQLYCYSLTMLRNLLPEKIKNNLLERTLQSIPIEHSIDKTTSNFEPVGGSSLTRVYRVISANEKYFTLGISKESTDERNKQKIFAMAKWLQQDFHKVNSLFNSTDIIIPSQQYATYLDNNGEWRYLFIRDYIPSPIRDIFQFSNNELVEILRADQRVAKQVTQFLDITEKNIHFVLNEELDLLGHHNLCLATINNRKELVLLDAHTRGPNCEKGVKYQRKIRARIDFLINILQMSKSWFSYTFLNTAIKLSILTIAINNFPTCPDYCWDITKQPTTRI